MTNNYVYDIIYSNKKISIESVNIMKVRLNKSFPGLKDRYYIDDLGNLYTDYGTKKMTDTLKNKGYIGNSLIRQDGSHKVYMRHRLVLQTFNPIDDYDEKQVNHIDGVKTHNYVENLEWCTNQENRIHACQNGLAARLVGEQNPHHKFTEDEVLEIIQSLQNHTPYSVLTEKYQCSKSAISAIKNKRTWTYLTKDIMFT